MPWDIILLATIFIFVGCYTPFLWYSSRYKQVVRIKAKGQRFIAKIEGLTRHRKWEKQLSVTLILNGKCGNKKVVTPKMFTRETVDKLLDFFGDQEMKVLALKNKAIIFKD